MGYRGNYKRKHSQEQLQVIISKHQMMKGFSIFSKGEVAGVNIVSGSGRQGNDTIRIRGFGSLSGEQQSIICY